MINLFKQLINCVIFYFLIANFTNAQVLEVDMEQYLQKLDPVWDTTHTYFYEGAFIGNGLEGAMIYREDSNSLRWDINRSDLTIPSKNPEYSRARFGLGKFVLKPKGKIINTSLRIDLWNGIAKGEIQTDLGVIQFKSYVHHQTHLMVTELDEQNESSSFYFVPEKAKNILEYQWLETKAKFEYPGNEITKTQKENITIYRQEFTNEKSYFEVGLTEQKENNKRYFISCISTNVPFSKDTTSTINKFSQIKNSFIKQQFESHKIWWHNFYLKSFVQIPDYKIASFYWMQRYKIGSSLRADGPILDLMGPWFAYTPWPAIWWNLNVQLTYSPLFSLNHLDLGETLYRSLDANINNLIGNVPEPFRHNSAGIGRVTTFDLKGEVNLLNSKFPYYDKEPGNLLWVMHNYYLQYLYCLDTNMLINRINPLLKRATNLYFNIIYQDTQGKYHLPETFSPEYALTKDANFDLSLFKWACQTLIKINKDHRLNAPQSKQWESVLNNLTPFPTDKNGFRIGSDTTLTSSHRHYSHLLMIYPLKLINTFDENNKKLVEKSIDYWLSLKGGHAGYTYTGAAAMNANLGRGDSALKYLNEFLKDLPVSTIYREAGPVIETPYSAITSIHEMILQSQEGIIKLFPAVPNTWENLSIYKLRTEQSFLISANRKNKKIEWVTIESLGGAKCLIQLPIPTNQILISGKRKHTFKKFANNIIEIDINKGEIILLSNRINCDPIIQEFPGKGKINFYGMKRKKI